MGKASWWATAACAVPVIGALLACGDGGANMNQRGVGDQPGGVPLGIGDIAVAPVGGYVLFARGTSLGVGWVDSGAIDTLPVSTPSRLAFAKTRSVVYVGSEADGEIDAVDVPRHRVLWHAAVADASTDGLRLASSLDDKVVLAANAHHVSVLDASDGRTLAGLDLPDGFVDMEILPDSSRALVVEKHTWTGDAPVTRVHVIALASGATSSFTVPNCSDRIVVGAGGERAFLAPTTCSRDPVSVIDLSSGHEHFDKNLPGFGPVARAPGSDLAVAFYDRTLGDPSLFDDATKMPGSDTARYQLMLIDTRTLAYDFAQVGDDLPRFAVTPDGNVLLVDSSLSTKGARLFDVPSRSFKKLDGPSLKLDNFVLSSDSRHAYALDPDLYDVDVLGALVKWMSVGFDPANLNISADDRSLFLRESESEICIYELATQRCKRRFVGGPVTTTP